MRPDIDLGRMLGAELYARGTTPTAMAEKCSPSDRTLRAYAKGELPIPPDVARELIVALDDEPFAIPAVREALVIRGRAHDLRSPPTRLEPAEIRVDTVELTLDVEGSRRSAVGALLAEQLREGLTGRSRLRGYRHAAHIDVGQATVRAHWDPWNKGGYWVRLQLAPWEPAHCRLLQHALRCASTRTVSGLLDEPPSIRVARIDVAADYPAEPRWLVLHRPFATTGRVVESKDWQVTQYAGGLGPDAELGAKLCTPCARPGRSRPGRRSLSRPLACRSSTRWPRPPRTRPMTTAGASGGAALRATLGSSSG